MRVASAVKAMKQARRSGSAEWRSYWRERPVDTSRVLYESFAGNGALGNPEAIFRALMADPAFDHLTHVWVLSKEAWSAASIRVEFANHPRVQFVRYKSPQYFRALFTAGYLINNATFPTEFTKRDGQVYLNTWHGTPFKTMGYDEPGGGPNARNVIRNFLSADYLLAANGFVAERMYEQAYRLSNIHPGRIITEGSPRVDRQFLGEGGKERVRRRLTDAGVSIRPDQKVVLYAPTWRGTSFQKPTNDIVRLAKCVRELKRRLPEDQQVLLRVHQQVYNFALEHPDLADILVPNEVPSNEVLGVTDVLVTDYSSIFFDFLATERPIVFYAPDLDDYDDYRGFYLDPEELPGPVVRTVTDLGDVLLAAGTGSEADPAVSHGAVRDEAQSIYASREDGEASRRVIDVVFQGSREHDVRPVASDGRTRILLYLGGMRSNGITTSALNLLNNIDHDRFDVSVLYQYSSSKEIRANEAKIHPRVRVLPRSGGMLWSLRSERERAQILHGGEAARGQSFETAERMFGFEWRRCFGLAEFDHIIDFSGYAAFWALLLQQGPAKSHSIWLHNDLKADQMREVDGERPHELNLGSVFNTYAGFDHLVSVSPALMEINAKNLAAAAPREKHTYARNTIDASYITRMAYGERLAVPDTDASVPVADLPRAVRELSDVHGVATLEAAVQRHSVVRELMPRERDAKVFVTIGRLSPEKNHERLIRAFDLVHQEDPRSRLIIIGGGPLQQELTELSRDLGLGSVVTMAGQQSNPHAVLARSETFVLSSDYEGQPMVILEARVLGRPVVSTNFDSVGGSLTDGVGLVVERDVEALAEGMRAALRDEVPNPPFDPAEYNREATSEFYEVIGVAQAE